ncbi:hypothetical protein TBLA_0C05820 [Henningerozyma blattae CBS 6284]|uniref:Ribosomal protein/NADH dehydrogenase domain-containing protein n=1 Tax=Henningerozyma blattae (strain ATCC 34711 / CBS 6284 / DSM 70876 / NBRC 10599 / NRRL Y-10934 / UCD 77-7) TaxID=1071380 RepID=I2H1X7_HENB6|nr:hypothetical protein TBLA_0C05820 [Tetrapisispora blattae CBS 6284]CCH60379.1 hypothetical protein TBLA_0C05820 [Tetrapisispora blattae CBS 6284]
MAKSSVIKQLKALNQISYTTKEALVYLKPDKIKSINLFFNFKNEDGHMGARKFWRNYIPTIQFYNPTLLVNVTRTHPPVILSKKSKIKKVLPENMKFVSEQDLNRCSLEVKDHNDKTINKIEMKSKHSTDILKEFLEQVEHEKIPEADLIKLE